MKLVNNWRRLWRAWSVWALALGAVLPSVLDVLADNVATLPHIDDGYKSGIRLGCIIAALLLRTVKQPDTGPLKGPAA